MKFIAFLFVFFIGFCALAQTPNSNYRTKKVIVNDTIMIDSVSINSNFFSIKTKDNLYLDTSFYTVDFPKAILTFKKPIEADSIIINYLRFPDFLTKTYKQLDEKIIVDNNDNIQTLYKLSQSNQESNYIPFDGLTTSGSISRGVTI
jgi:hypothetical protein